MKLKESLKKFLAFLLSTAMIITYMPVSVFALENDESGEETSTEVTVESKEDKSDDAPKNVETAAPATEVKEPAPVKENESTVVVPDSQKQDQEPAETPDTRGPPESETPNDQGADNAVQAGNENAAPADAGETEALRNAEGELTKGADAALLAAEGNAKADAEEDKTWTVTFYDRDADVHKVVEVTKGEAIGEDMPSPIAREDYIAYWAIGERVSNGQGYTTKVTGPRVTSSYVPTADTTLVPDYAKITYTVTFLDGKNGSVVTTRTVDVDTSYCLNDIPAVPHQDGSVGKWVYSGGDFTNSVTATGNMEVWAEYEETAFTVTYKYMIDGAEKTYQTDKYSKGDQLELPTAPVEEGHEFIGWYVGETKYNGGEVVNGNMVLQGRFTNMYSVSFVVLNDNGSVKETLTQYFRTSGDKIETMPQSPFVSGKHFVKWVIQGTDTEVTADTVVTENFTAVAVFEEVESYKITVDYWYEADNGAHHTFDTVITEIASGDFNEDGKYIITPPASTQTDSELVNEGPRYYASKSSIEIKKTDFNADHEYATDVEYVAYTAQYDVVYLLKDLDGNGYTEIERESGVKGVLGTYAAPSVKDYPYATLEAAEGAVITQAEGQELEVKYNRKSFQLTYETNGGSYVGGTSAPYGTNVRLSSTVPTKAGYTFGGWYLDEGLTQPAGSSVTLEGNTTVYAKWNGATVNYTIVYLFEKYNDAGTSSSYVYDNSRDATGTVGSTVQASSTPTVTRKGWEKDTARNAASSVEIAADGSSVLYVYYKLTEYTFHFRPGTYSYNYTNYNVTAPLNGESKTGNNNWSYTFTAKLGQDISSKWISAGNGTYRRNGSDRSVSFSGWLPSGGSTVYVTKRLTLAEDMLPSSGTSITYTGYWLTNTVTYTVNYMLQNADNDEYTRSADYSQTYNYSSGSSLSPTDIQGYPYVRRTDSGNTTTFYYNRDKFKIDYYYGSRNLKTISDIKFDAAITSGTYNWRPTAAQCGVDSDYTFAGWYSDSGLTTPYTFSTMPASNLVLYAKWTAPSFTVSFVDEDGTTQLADSQTVEKYKKAEKPAAPTKNGYTFEGWYTAAEGGQMYDWNTQIIANTTIYAHWTQDPLSYTVHYVMGSEDGEEVAPAKTVTNPNWVEGEEITEKALAVSGYRPDAGEKSVKLSIGSTNDIYFIYSVKGETTGYTVQYFAEGTTTPVHDPKVVNNVSGDTTSVVEFAVEVEGLYPDVEEITYTLGSDPAKNIITFYYSKYKSINVTVNFVDMNGAAIADSDTKTLKVGTTFTLSRTPIPEWELNKAVKGKSYNGEAAGASVKITEELVNQNPNGLEFTLFYQKRLTITANSFSQQYNGKALTMPAALADQVTVEGLMDGDSLTSISFRYQGADNTAMNGRINAGVATVTPVAPQISGVHDTNYYKIRALSGSLEVTKINVTIRIEPDRWTGLEYTGEVYKAGFTNPTKEVSDYIIISHEGYRNEYLDDVWAAVKEKATYDASAAGQKYYGLAESDAGDYTWNLTLTTAELPQNDNYSVSLYVRPGRLQILAREITVTANGGSKPYDGTAITAEGTGYAITSGSLAKGDAISVALSGSQTDLGRSPATVGAVTITRGEGDAAENVTKNYKITTVDGTLEITPVTSEYVITVTGKNASYQYDGSEKSVNGYSVSDYDSKINFTGIAEDDAKATAKGTAAGTYTMTMSEADFNATSEYYTNIKIVVVPGKLTISAATEPYVITVTGNSDTKTYNGSEQSVNGYTVSEHDASITVTGPAQNDAKATAKGTNAGTYKMALSEADFTATSDNYDNIEIVVVPGTLTITPITDEYEIKVTGNSDTKVYNGSEQSVNGYSVSNYDSTINFTGIAQDDAKATAKGTNAGTYTMTMAEADFSATSVNYTNIKITVVPGTLTITPITDEYEITVTGNSDTKVYNRSEQSVSGYTVSEYDESINFTGIAQDDAKATAKGTNAGTYTMTMSAADFSAASV
ncbi:MAG: InlB B-repeat-containing protein, partial [Mogibacterium sp.]|nr:InlB B-repeat-containing protein [Mogibacterium sp.]